MTQGTTKRMIIMLTVAAVLVGGVVWFQGFKNTTIAKAIKGQSNPPQTVSTTVAQESSWQPTVEALGNFSASQQARSERRSRRPGHGHPLRFGPEGARRPTAGGTECRAAEGAAGTARSRRPALAEINLRRDQAQLEVQAVSQAVVDTDEATLKSAQAQVAAQRALIAQKTIVAPFSGQLGIRQVNLGQYLAPGAAVVTLQKLDPMNVDFTVPQSQIDLIRIGMKAQVETSAAPGRTFEGTVTAIEPQVDAATRNLTVRARVPNPAGALLPGVVRHGAHRPGPPRNYVTLPNAAVSYNPYGATVFVVKDDGKGPDGKPRLDRRTALHHHRPDARRPGGRARGREGGRDRGDRRPAQAAQRLAHPGEQQRAAVRQPESARAQLLIAAASRVA